LAGFVIGSMKNRSANKIKRKFFHKLKYTYRLVFYNDSTFAEVWHVRFTLINILSLIGTIFLLLVGGSIALVMFTPMREWVPGYPTQAMRNQLIENILRIDSLEYESQVRDRYFSAIRSFITGEETEAPESLPNGSNINYSNITFTRSEEDSLLRRQVEEEEQFNFVMRPNVPVSLINAHFFKPVEGIVTNKFDPQTRHFGIDLVANPNEVVKASLDGTVIMSVWTIETGYVVQLQHASNMLTVYKHNASLLKKAGEQVKAGDAIAIIGNSGELTSGPHLHFEIWQNGRPVNPEDYIAF
jgi:murein DD-endopeptidase MepM/ murein hydrolase activator NlpD